MFGGITVVGCVTGTHLIADINVAVPHKIAVFIPAEQVLRSKDLHRSLQTNRIMKLDGGSALRTDLGATSPRQADNARIAQLEAENKQLRRELEQVQAREAGLHQVLSSLGGQLTGIQGALGRLEAQGPVREGVRALGIYPATEMQVQSEVVGGEAPTFMPSQITPDDVETSIQVQTETAKDSNLSGARSKLRELRGKTGSGG